MSEGKQRVSIVIPCFNLGDYLADTVDSALAQTHRDIEVVVVNDGSTDAKTYRIIDELSGPRVRTITTPNRGLGAARNTGIRASTGDYVLPLDADDLIVPTYAARAIEVLERDPRVRVAYSLVEQFGDETGILRIEPYSLATMLVRNLIVCTAMFRRSDYDRTRGYSEKMSYLGWEDWNFWLSLIELDHGSLNEAAYCIPEPLFRYRIRAASMIRSRSEAELHQLRREVFLDHIDLYALHFEDPINLRHRLDELNHKYDRLRRDHEGLERSRALRFGRLLLSPIQFLSDLVGWHGERT